MTMTAPEFPEKIRMANEIAAELASEYKVAKPDPQYVDVLLGRLFAVTSEMRNRHAREAGAARFTVEAHRGRVEVYATVEGELHVLIHGDRHPDARSSTLTSERHLIVQDDGLVSEMPTF